MPLFGRKPPVQDQALGELSEMFFRGPDQPTPGTELLDVSKLDFSVESLRHVDDWLEAMAARSLPSPETQVVVLRCGAYVGEVIRRNATVREYHWLDYDGAVRVDGQIKSLGGKSLGLMAVLWDGGKGFTFPLGKVGKFLENGREDSTYFYASVTIATDSEGA